MKCSSRTAPSAAAPAKTGAASRYLAGATLPPRRAAAGHAPPRSQSACHACQEAVRTARHWQAAASLDGGASGSHGSQHANWHDHAHLQDVDHATGCHNPGSHPCRATAAVPHALHEHRPGRDDTPVIVGTPLRQTMPAKRTCQPARLPAPNRGRGWHATGCRTVPFLGWHATGGGLDREPDHSATQRLPEIAANRRVPLKRRRRDIHAPIAYTA